MNLLNELKRRNVFKVGVAYLALGWVVIQVTDVAVPALNLPESLNSIVVYLGLIGFPFALFFAWAFELTPDGVKPTSEVDKTVSSSHSTGRKLDFAIIALLIIGVSYLLYDKTTGPLQSENSDMPSVAVLPFVNMSADPTQEYFSDGITEELLNSLVKIPGLRVAARTSAFSYKGENRDVRQIGAELGVETIVEGSVRKDGDNLRITAQAIRVSDGFHLWSETYDRKLKNIFAIQEEISTSIAGALAVPLGLAENEKLVVDRITNMAAYDKYLQARIIIKNRDGQQFQKAVDFLREVVTLEPDYAPGWAALSLAYNVVPFYISTLDGAPLNLVALQYESEATARRAVSINPSSALAQHVMANALRWRRQWARAEDHYIEARKLDPTAVGIIEDYGEFLNWMGKLDEALALATKGVELEATSSLPYMRYSSALWALHKFKQAEQSLQQVVKDHPTVGWPQSMLSSVYIANGKYAKALEIVKACDFCAFGIEQDVLIDVITAIINGDDLEQFKNDNLLYYGDGLELMHKVGGDALVLESLEYSSILIPAYNDLPLSSNHSAMGRVRKDIRYKQMALQTGLVDYWRERGWPKFCRPISDYDFECGANQ